MPNSGDVPRLLTAEDVAEQLQSTVRTVQRWVQEGNLRAVSLPGGRGLRFYPDDVEEALTTRGTDSADGPGTAPQPSGDDQERLLTNIAIVNQKLDLLLSMLDTKDRPGETSTDER